MYCTGGKKDVFVCFAARELYQSCTYATRGPALGFGLALKRSGVSFRRGCCRACVFASRGSTPASFHDSPLCSPAALRTLAARRASNRNKKESTATWCSCYLSIVLYEHIERNYSTTCRPPTPSSSWLLPQPPLRRIMTTTTTLTTTRHHGKPPRRTTTATTTSHCWAAPLPAAAA